VCVLETIFVGTSLSFGKAKLCVALLQSAGVQFPQRDQVTPSNRPHSQLNEINNVPNTDQAPTRHHQAESQTVAESR